MSHKKAMQHESGANTCYKLSRTFSQLLICLSFGLEERLRSAECDDGRFFFPTPAERL